MDNGKKEQMLNIKTIFTLSEASQQNATTKRKKKKGYKTIIKSEKKDKKLIIIRKKKNPENNELLPLSYAVAIWARDCKTEQGKSVMIERS